MPFGSSNDTGSGLGISPTQSSCHTDAFLPATSFERNSNIIVHEQVSVFKLLTNLSNWGQQQEEHMKNTVKNIAFFPPNIKFLPPQTVLSQPHWVIFFRFKNGNDAKHSNGLSTCLWRTWKQQVRQSLLSTSKENQTRTEARIHYPDSSKHTWVTFMRSSLQPKFLLRTINGSPLENHRRCDHVMK